MADLGDDFREWYEVVKVREFRPLAEDFPEFAAVLTDELWTRLARLVRMWHLKPPAGDVSVTWSPPDALRIGFGTDAYTMQWDQTLEDASPNAKTMIELIADQWPGERRTSS